MTCGFRPTSRDARQIVSMSLSFVCDGDVVGRPQAPGVWGPVPTAGLEPATYRLEGVPGRALCRFEEYQGSLGRVTSFGATVSVSLPRPLRRGGPRRVLRAPYRGLDQDGGPGPCPLHHEPRRNTIISRR